MTGPLLLTAWLSSPLAGYPPQLDALLECSLSPMEEGFQGKQKQGIPHSQVDRKYPCPPQAIIPIPILRKRVGPWQIACCSEAILPKPSSQTVEHVHKKLAT